MVTSGSVGRGWIGGASGANAQSGCVRVGRSGVFVFVGETSPVRQRSPCLPCPGRYLTARAFCFGQPRGRHQPQFAPRLVAQPGWWYFGVGMYSLLVPCFFPASRPQSLRYRLHPWPSTAIPSLGSVTHYKMYTHHTVQPASRAHYSSRGTVSSPCVP